MRTYLSIFFKAAALLVGVFMATPHMMAENTIDFSKSTNLKAVYDAGLRPWRVRPDEISTLLISDQQIRVVVPGGGTFSMDVQIGNFGVIEENKLAKADFISQPMLLNQAVVKAREICNVLGIDMGRRAGMVGFEEKASQLLSMKDQTPVPQYWNGRTDKNGVTYSVTLSPLFGLNEIRGKVDVTIVFVDPGKPMKFLTEPIKPPQGYEHMSMEPPRSDPNQKPFPDPEYSFESMKKRIQEHGHIGIPTDSAESKEPALSPDETFALEKEISEQQRQAQQRSPLPWLLGGLAVMIGLAFLLWRKLRS